MASDGAKGFLSSTHEHAVNALIVLDHFHVKSYLNNAVDTVRKEELAKARKAKDAELTNMLHCKKRFILMKNKQTKYRENLIQKLAELNEPIYKAMLLKEQFLAIYTERNRASGLL